MLPGSSLFAEATFAYATPPLTVGSDSITFDGYGFQNASVVVSSANFENSGAVETNLFALPRTDGRGFLSQYWRGKQISLEGYVKAETAQDLEARIDALKKACSVQQGVLSYRNAVGTRQITATMTVADFRRDSYHVTFCPFRLTFEATDAFWKDSANESATFEGFNATRSESLSNSGSGATFPKVHFAFSSATGVSSASFSVNGRAVSVNSPISSGSIVTFDCQAKTVELNGTPSDYSGTFPELLPGENYATFDASGTFTAEIIAIWPKNYL